MHKKLFRPYKIFRHVTKQIKYKNEILLDLDINDWIQQSLYFLDEYEEKEIKFLKSFLKAGDIFVDVGANVGLFTLAASSVVGESGKVYAFEPYSKNYFKLVHHLKLNGCTNVIAERLAVSEKDGWITIKGDENDDNDGMVSAYHDTAFTMSETVPCISLEQYVSGKISRAIRFIKIDIEGGEYSALKGMATILTRDQPVILIEINPQILPKAGLTVAMVEEELFRHLYAKYYLDHNGRLLTTRAAEDNSFNFVFIQRSQLNSFL